MKSQFRIEKLKGLQLDCNTNSWVGVLESMPIMHKFRSARTTPIKLEQWIVSIEI